MCAVCGSCYSGIHISLLNSCTLSVYIQSDGVDRNELASLCEWLFEVQVVKFSGVYCATFRMVVSCISMNLSVYVRVMCMSDPRLFSVCVCVSVSGLVFCHAIARRMLRAVWTHLCKYDEDRGRVEQTLLLSSVSQALQL